MSLRKTSRTIVISIIAACLMMSVPCCTYAAGEEAVQTYNVERDRERADEYYEKAVENAERAYYRAMEEVQSGRPGKLLNGRSTGEWVFETLYGMYAAIRRSAPFVSLMSVLCGVTVCFLAKKNKAMFKRAIEVGIIGIPLTLLFFVFGLGSMVGVFGQ